MIVFDDSDVDAVVKTMAFMKYRNAGQVCISPTRFLVQEAVYPSFVEKFVAGARAVKVGDGMDPDTKMGPLANPRRSRAMEAHVADAKKHGGKVPNDRAALEGLVSVLERHDICVISDDIYRKLI